MKKRIGTKTYDTEKSEFICESDLGKIFRKKTGFGEYYAYNEQTQNIVPLKYAVAKDMVKALNHKESDKKWTAEEKLELVSGSSYLNLIYKPVPRKTRAKTLPCGTGFFAKIGNCCLIMA